MSESTDLVLRILGTIFLWSIGFVILWRVVVELLSRLARWPELKRQYATSPQSGDSLWRSASGHLGLVWYAGTLTLGSSAAGLYIAPQFPFHFGSAPIIVPWSDIKVHRATRLFQKLTYFEFLRVPGLALRVSGKGAEWLVASGGPTVEHQ